MIAILATSLLAGTATAAAFAPEPYGAFLDTAAGEGADAMLDLRSPAKQWQVPLPAHNPLQHAAAPARSRDYGAFLDKDNMLEMRTASASPIWQVPLPASNPLHRPNRKAVEPHGTAAAAERGGATKKARYEPRNDLPGYFPSPEMMEALEELELEQDLAGEYEPRNHLPGLFSNPELMEKLGKDLPGEGGTKKMFFSKKNMLPDTDVFGRDDDGDSDDVRSKIEAMEESDELDVHTKHIYFEPRHKLPDHHYGSDL